MRYLDKVRLATVTSDGYGDKTVTLLEEVPASFSRRSGYAHSANAEGETSDATVYLMHTHPTVLNRKDDLEGMYVQVEPFTDNNWYRVVTASVAQRKLLNNAIDNIYCTLEKVAGLPYVYNS